MKKGLIKISNELYKNNWDVIHLIFKDFKPIHIEFRYWENNTWYFYGECEYFEYINEDDSSPQYEVWFTKQPSGEFTYEFKKA